MSLKNKTRYAIHGVLNISPCTGYDIKKYCDNIIAHFWNENYGHIYPVLKTLQEDGLIERVEEETKDRKKKYAITDRGREEFLNWLKEPVIYQPARSEFLLKLSFSKGLGKEELKNVIGQYKEDHLKRLQDYGKMEQYLKNGGKVLDPSQGFFVNAPLRYGIHSAKSVISWCDEMLEQINLME